MWAFTDSEMMEYIKDKAAEHTHLTVAAYLVSNDSEQLEDGSMYAEVYHKHCSKRAKAAKCAKTRQMWLAELLMIEQHFAFLRGPQA